MEPTFDMNVALFSFGFKHSLPEADTVIDVRFLPNPYYVPQLSSRTGLDKDVADYVLDNQTAIDFFHHFESFLLAYIMSHANADRSSISFAVGCTGGRHRSVAVTEKLRKIIEKLGVTVDMFHRDINKV